MKRRAILLALAILLSTLGLVQGQQGELHGLIDLTYQSRYIWRGFTIYGDESAIQPAIDLDLYGTGFGISTMMHRANSSGFENWERWDFSAYYYNRLFADEAYITDYKVSWVYYSFPDMVSDWYNLQEMNVILSWPKILAVDGLVPSYVCAKLWPANTPSHVGSGSPGSGTASGFFHILMLDYGIPIESLEPEVPEHRLNLYAELVYNDGVGPQGQNVDQDWSNAVFGISTDMNFGKNFTLTPALYHQIVMEKTVNPDEDETWFSISLKYKF